LEDETMRHAILILLVGIAGCSQQKSSESTQQLVAKDKVCATLTTEATCDADTADGCTWVELAVSQIACPPGAPCPIQTTGICLGNADGNQCVIADQCGRQTTQNGCLASADCGWVPGVCAEPAIVCAGPNCPPLPPCPPFVCQPINPCDGLDASSCSANPDCELQDVQNCTVPPACPPYTCPANEPNCPTPIGYNCPPAQPPTCSSSVTCVHAPVVCEGGTGGSSNGNGNGPPGTSGGSPGSPPSSTNG
jgi:hypothetical protein